MNREYDCLYCISSSMTAYIYQYSVTYSVLTRPVINMQSYLGMIISINFYAYLYCYIELELRVNSAVPFLLWDCTVVNINSRQPLWVNGKVAII